MRHSLSLVSSFCTATKGFSYTIDFFLPRYVVIFQCWRAESLLSSLNPLLASFALIRLLLLLLLLLLWYRDGSCVYMKVSIILESPFTVLQEDFSYDSDVSERKEIVHWFALQSHALSMQLAAPVTKLFSIMYMAKSPIPHKKMPNQSKARLTCPIIDHPSSSPHPHRP